MPGKRKKREGLRKERSLRNLRQGGMDCGGGAVYSTGTRSLISLIYAVVLPVKVIGFRLVC